VREGWSRGTNKHRFSHPDFCLQNFQETMTWWLGIISSTADVTFEMLKLEAGDAVASRS
jgi:hypothetical protein